MAVMLGIRHLCCMPSHSSVRVGFMQEDFLSLAEGAFRLIPAPLLGTIHPWTLKTRA